VIAATDPNADVGVVLEKARAGLCCESDNIRAFLECVDKMKDENLRVSCGKAAKQMLFRDFHVSRSVNTILLTKIAK